MDNSNKTQCNCNDKIVGIYFFEASDFTIDKKTGKYRIKRKYGKFKRQCFYLDKSKT